MEYYSTMEYYTKMIYNGILFSLKEELNSDSYSNINEP